MYEDPRNEPDINAPNDADMARAAEPVDESDDDVFAVPDDFDPHKRAGLYYKPSAGSRKWSRVCVLGCHSMAEAQIAGLIAQGDWTTATLTKIVIQDVSDGFSSFLAD